MLLVKNKNNGLPTMDSFLNEFFGMDNLFNSNVFSSNYGTSKVNVIEKDDSYSIDIVVPGFNKEDINVELNDGILTISSKVESSNEETSEKYIKKEFVKSSFERSFYIPDDADVENIEASMDNGILSINLTKIKELEDKTNVKRIDIK